MSTNIGTGQILFLVIFAVVIVLLAFVRPRIRALSVFFVIIWLICLVLIMKMRGETEFELSEAAIQKFERIDQIGYGQIISGVAKLPDNTYYAEVKVDGHIYSCIVWEHAKKEQWAKVSKITFSRENCDGSGRPLFYAVHSPHGKIVDEE